MNELPIPFLPTALWFLACGCLVLIMLVIFGYHLYQRSRIRALVTDSGDVASLAARKEMLEADVAELRDWLAKQRSEKEKLEAERHQQELARVELARLERQLQTKRDESAALVARVADLNLGFEKRRQIHARLETEIRNLEEQRLELAPMEKYAQELRLELDQGRATLAQIAQEEVRTQALRTQAEILRREISELGQELEPLREERTKLSRYIDQARHSAAVRNEQLLEQKREQKSLETGNIELAREREGLLAEIDRLRQAKETAKADLAELESSIVQRKSSGEQLRQSVMAEQAQLELLIQRCGEKAAEVDNLAARKAILEREMETLVKPELEQKEQPKRIKRERHTAKCLKVGMRGRAPHHAERAKVVLAESLEHVSTEDFQR